MITITQEALIEGPGIFIPDPIQPDELKLDAIAELEDGIGRKHEVFVLTPEDVMPEQLAEWLRYRSLTEHVVAAEHEGDKYRFSSVKDIEEKFLVDQGGRTLFFAVGKDNGRLYAATWMHRLQNDRNDHMLSSCGLTYLEKLEIYNQPVERTSTFATREYGAAVRRGLDLKLGTLGVDRYFQEHDPDCLVVVGRYGANDNFQIEIGDTVDPLQAHRFKPIDGGYGWVVLAALNPVLEMSATDL